MRLNSDSQIGQNPSNNKPLGLLSFKTKLQSFQNYPDKSSKKVQKFYSMSLSKSKKMNQNPRINIIIKIQLIILVLLHHLCILIRLMDKKL